MIYGMPQALLQKREKGREAIFSAYRIPEAQAINDILGPYSLSAQQRKTAQIQAKKFVVAIRQAKKKFIDFDALLATYNLTTQEGLVLMNLAEALLRIPDNATADALIYDKLRNKDWLKNYGVSQSRFVDLASSALHLTGKTISATSGEIGKKGPLWQQLAYKMTSPVMRHSVRQVMRKMGEYFVLAPSIQQAIKASKKWEAQGERFSYDMLGEAALTDADAARYEKAYEEAIEALGAHNPPQAGKKADMMSRPGISIKLSALHPTYSVRHYDDVMTELIPKLKKLVLKAKKYNLLCTIDAEEADRLDLMLDVVEQVYTDPDLDGWEGFGLAVQAYQKRALPVLEWLASLATRHGRRINVRLVKGAYWDTEIKRTQELGLRDYPVYTRKYHTDISYGSCASFMLKNRDKFLCSFATHNPLTVSWVLSMLDGDFRGVEFQRLHGMGEDLYAQLHKTDAYAKLPCRIYAPIGPYKDLLPYLVRRLLENGANATFVNRLRDTSVPVEEIVEDPFDALLTTNGAPHPLIPLPENLYGPARKNAKGFDISDVNTLRRYEAFVSSLILSTMQVHPTGVDTKTLEGLPCQALKKNWLPEPTPFAQVVLADSKILNDALRKALNAQEAWAATPIKERAGLLQIAANKIEESFFKFILFCQLDGGRVLEDAISEVRESIDFCRYYAQQLIEKLMPQILPGPTGEENSLSLKGRGPFICISPWNFPMAIFTGQVVAALAAGNTVICKPAQQTPVIASLVVAALHEAGVPQNVLQFMPAKAQDLQSALLTDPRVAGVLFTGSTGVAKRINITLAERPGPIVPLIAETGGVNAMVVDSSALFEQVVKDVINSAFQSAGQRCSALRLLYVQEDVVKPLMTMLEGALQRIVLGSPLEFCTDVGPVIDSRALEELTTYIDESQEDMGAIYSMAVPGSYANSICPPSILTLKDAGQLTKEIFGPVLHVTTFKAGALDDVVAHINNSGFGLTLGIHSRVDERISYIVNHVHVGNIYVNRNMIGAVVGVQPFGGEGLSGTGPKAGGPNYLTRLVAEHTLCINIMATGGNSALMAIDLRK